MAKMHGVVVVMRAPAGPSRYSGQDRSRPRTRKQPCQPKRNRHHHQITVQATSKTRCIPSAFKNRTSDYIETQNRAQD